MCTGGVDTYTFPQGGREPELDPFCVALGRYGRKLESWEVRTGRNQSLLTESMVPKAALGKSRTLNSPRAAPGQDPDYVRAGDMPAWGGVGGLGGHLHGLWMCFTLNSHDTASAVLYLGKPHSKTFGATREEGKNPRNPDDPVSSCQAIPPPTPRTQTIMLCKYQELHFWK